MDPDHPYIGGVPFRPLFHHDGRFVRLPGLFAFARRRPDGRHQVLHLELTEAINRAAGPGHRRWSWAMAQGMNEILIHLAGAKATVLPASDGLETVVWHPQAEVVFGEGETDVEAAPDDQPPCFGVASRTSMTS